MFGPGNQKVQIRPCPRVMFEHKDRSLSLSATYCWLTVQAISELFFKLKKKSIHFGFRALSTTKTFEAVSRFEECGNETLCQTTSTFSVHRKCGDKETRELLWFTQLYLLNSTPQLWLYKSGSWTVSESEIWPIHEEYLDVSTPCFCTVLIGLLVL